VSRHGRTSLRAAATRKQRAGGQIRTGSIAGRFLLSWLELKDRNGAMTRVAILGNAGGGKSTLARKLAAAQQLPCHAIDRLQWLPGWEPVPPTQFDREHEAIIAGERWIVDGVGDLEALARRIARADTVLLVDLPLRTHLWWATRRQIRSIIVGRPDGPDGCPMWRVTWRIYRMIWWINREWRPKFLALVADVSPETQVFHLRSPRDIAAFEQQYCPAAPA
jgi:adenylate kinase family enzyme